MKAKIYPSKVHGQITIPPSKSMAHRAIICASLAKGTSTITNVSYSEDILATLHGMEQLGAIIKRQKDAIQITGIADFKQCKSDTIFCNESGSTLRFFIPIFSLCEKKIIFTGKERLLKRPQTIYEEIFHKQGLRYQQSAESITICGPLKSTHYELEGNISSQFISGLLFALPLLEEDSTIHIKEPFESASYVDLTLEMLQHFGIEVTYQDKNTLYIKGNQTYQANDYHVEGDYSQLAFFAVLAAINNDLDVNGVNASSKQGDQVILSILKKATIPVEPLSYGYHISCKEFKGNEIDLQNCPDLGPILCVLAMYAKGTTRIYNAQRLRYKESDRIAAMESELKKCGVQISTTESEIIINGKNNYAGDVVLHAHNDHRIVMSLCVAATLFHQSIIIDGVEAINKSYPDFFEDFKRIGGKVELIYD